MALRRLAAIRVLPSIIVLLCPAAYAAAGGCSEGDGDEAACPARSHSLLQARFQNWAELGRGALNETALAQVLEEEGHSKEELGGIVTCIVLKCMNFLDEQREENCAACIKDYVDHVEATQVGVNGLTVEYVRAGLSMLTDKSQDSYANNFCGGDVSNCTVKENFPGNGVTSVMGWDRVAEMLRAMPAKEWSGEWWRGNELGFIINNPFFWSKMGVNPISNLLGALPKQHAVIRPIMEELWTLDSPDRRSEVQALVTDAIKGFLEDRREYGLAVPSDIKALVHQILYQVTFGKKASFRYAQQFVEVQAKMTSLGTLSQLLPARLYEHIDGMALARDSAAAYAKEYAGLLEERFGARLAQEDCSPSTSCMAQLASAVFDSLYSAGGLSVPTNMGTGIAVLFSTHGSNPFPQASFSRDQALSFFWENIRFFPAVVGFPHWEKRPTCAGLTDEQTAALSKPDGKTEACPLGASDPTTEFPKVNQYVGGKRVVPVLALAQKDPRKWGADAHEFVLRELKEYEKSLGFAEGAVDDSVAAGAMNRVCPGKDLALMIGATFFELFNKGDWAQPRVPIEFTSGPRWVNIEFTLSSKKMVRECREECPDWHLQCNLDKNKCKFCADCSQNPPKWWQKIRQAACSHC